MDSRGKSKEAWVDSREEARDDSMEAWEDSGEEPRGGQCVGKCNKSEGGGILSGSDLRTSSGFQGFGRGPIITKKSRIPYTSQHAW